MLFQANPDARGDGDYTLVAERLISKSTEGVDAMPLSIKSAHSGFINITMNEERLLNAGRPSLPQKGNFEIVTLAAKGVRTRRTPLFHPSLMVH
jgi:hypothetical protein